MKRNDTSSRKGKEFPKPKPMTLHTYEAVLNNVKWEIIAADEEEAKAQLIEWFDRHSNAYEIVNLYMKNVDPWI